MSTVRKKYELPEELLDALRKGTCKFTEGVIRNSKTGKIISFVKVVGEASAESPEGVLDNSDLTILSLFSKSVSPAALAASPVVLGVVLAGFHLTLKQLKAILTEIGKLSHKIDEVVVAQRRDQFSKLTAAIERLELSRRRSDSARADKDLDLVLQPLLEGQAYFCQLLAEDALTGKSPKLICHLYEALHLASWAICETLLQQGEFAEVQLKARQFCRELPRLLDKLEQLLAGEDLLTSDEAGHFLLCRKLPSLRSGVTRIEIQAEQAALFQARGISITDWNQACRASERPALAILEIVE